MWQAYFLRVEDADGLEEFKAGSICHIHTGPAYVTNFFTIAKGSRASAMWTLHFMLIFFSIASSMKVLLVQKVWAPVTVEFVVVFSDCVCVSVNM